LSIYKTSAKLGIQDAKRRKTKQKQTQKKATWKSCLFCNNTDINWTSGRVDFVSRNMYSASFFYTMEYEGVFIIIFFLVYSV